MITDYGRTLLGFDGSHTSSEVVAATVRGGVLTLLARPALQTEPVTAGWPAELLPDQAAGRARQKPTGGFRATRAQAAPWGFSTPRVSPAPAPGRVVLPAQPPLRPTLDQRSSRASFLRVFAEERATAGQIFIAPLWPRLTDRTGRTDSTAALQAAIGDAGVLGGYSPPGDD